MAEKVKCTNCKRLTDVIICHDCLERDLAADRKRIENMKKRMEELPGVYEKLYKEHIEGLEAVINKAVEIEDGRIKLIANQAATIAELEKQAKIKDSLAKGVMALAKIHEQLEEAKAENQRLRDAIGKLTCRDCQKIIEGELDEVVYGDSA